MHDESKINIKSCLKYLLAPEQCQQLLRNDYILPINKMQKKGDYSISFFHSSKIRGEI